MINYDLIDSEHHHFTYGGNAFTGYFDFKDVAHWLNRTRFQMCADCGHPFDFSRDAVEGYEHSGGFTVGTKKYWLYITCPKCRYQTSLVKLGVKRGEE